MLPLIRVRQALRCRRSSMPPQLRQNKAGAEGDSSSHQRVVLDAALNIFDSLGAAIAQLIDLVPDLLKCGDRSILDYARSFAANSGGILYQGDDVFLQPPETVLECIQIV